MKPKVYPESIVGNELFFINESLLNEKGWLKSAAVDHLPKRLKDEIISATPNLRSGNISESIYWLVNGLKDYPKKCKSCGGPVKSFHKYSTGYRPVYCDSTCANSSSEVQASKKKTISENFGVEFPGQVKAQK